MCYECKELYTTSTQVNSIAVKIDTEQKTRYKTSNKFEKSMHNEDS